MNNKSSRPIGDRTTVIDIADRDDMDDDMFPIDATKSWFTRDPNRRYLNFSTSIQEFTHKGSAEFGGFLQFDIGNVKSCDLLFTVALQIRLGHWFPPDILQRLELGLIEYDDPQSAWYYANSLGTALISRAELLLEDQVLETVDGDFSTMFSLLFSDINTQVAIGYDAYGRVSIPRLLNWPQTMPFPTSNGYITCLLPFSFQRIRLRNAFPLTSVKEGAVRIRLYLRSFQECVRRADGHRDTCDETPLGKTFTFRDIESDEPFDVTASSVIPPFSDTRLVTYGVLVDGKLRNALLRAPFERMFREVQTFRFTEPKKYTIGSVSRDVIRLQLPLEINGPVEELIWFIRRKAVANNNEWTNYSNRTEDEWNELTRPFESMLVGATLQVNGIQLIQADGEFFRREIAQRHRGGLVAYNNFVYGYTFAQEPGRQNPTGWMNASRSTDVRLRMDIRPPPLVDDIDLEFEVVVFSIAINWVRFENGLANKIFTD